MSFYQNLDFFTYRGHYMKGVLWKIKDLQVTFFQGRIWGMGTFSSKTGLSRNQSYIFYGIWIRQSGVMVFVLNLDKISLKKLFPTMNI